MKLSVFFEHVKEAASQSGMSIASVLQAVRKAGIEALEKGHRDLLGESKAYLKLIQEADLKISCIYETFDFGGIDDIQKAKPLIDTANRVGAKRVLVIPGFWQETEAKALLTVKEDYEKLCACLNENEKMQAMVEALKQMVVYAKEQTKGEVLVTLEDYDYFTSPCAVKNMLSYFMEQVPGLRYTLDIGNFAYSDEDVREAYEVLGAFISHVHCKDRGREEEVETLGLKNNKGLRPVPVGKGYMPMKELVTSLLRNGYDGYYAIEHFGAETQLAYMQASAAYLLGVEREVMQDN